MLASKRQHCSVVFKRIQRTLGQDRQYDRQVGIGKKAKTF